MTSVPTERLRQICGDALERLTSGPARDAVSDVAAALAEPLRVAVAGRVSSGKSTLVNALIGERIAQTAVGECTRLVAWYRYGDHERIEVRPRGGGAIAIPLSADKTMPEDIVAATRAATGSRSRVATVDSIEDVAHLSVYLRNPRLRDVTIIDTPGLESLTESNASATTRFLGFDAASNAAISGADALLYLSAATVRLDARSYLEQYRAAFRGGNVSALNALGVLSRVDTIGSDLRNPWPDALKVARRYAAQFRTMVADFIPVVGLLAETAASHALSERDATVLEKLHAGGSTKMLVSAASFVDRDHGVPDIDATQRRRLMESLGIYGLHVCLAALDDGRRGAAALEDALLANSGLDALRRFIDGTLGPMAVPVKAGAALSKLERISYLADPDNSAHLRVMRKAIDSVRADPQLHQLEQIRCMQLVAAQEISLEAGEDDELRRLAVGTSAADRLGLPGDTPVSDLARVALERGRRWHARENLAVDQRTEGRVARMAKVAYALLEQELTREARATVE